MLTRQKLIIALIKHSGGNTTRLRLVRQAFLLREYLSPCYARSFYQFIPYGYTPFSFTLYHELRNMVEAGLVALRSWCSVQLTDSGLEMPLNLDPALSGEFERFWADYGGYTVGELVDTVYEQYPWYALENIRIRREHTSQKETDCAVYSVGYEGMQVDGFLNLLLRSGIRQIIDVRRNAVSRVFGFHGSTLASLAERVGIGYRHMPRVGVPSAWRSHLDDEKDLDMLFTRYRDEVLPFAEDSVKSIASWMSSKPSTLMCMEADPSRCHRSVLAQSISDITGLAVSDLRWENGDSV